MGNDRMTPISEIMPEVLTWIDENSRGAQMKDRHGLQSHDGLTERNAMTPTVPKAPEQRNHKEPCDRWTAERWDRYAAAVLSALVMKYGTEDYDQEGDKDRSDYFIGTAARMADAMMELVQEAGSHR